MNLFIQMKEIKEMVKHLLIKHPHLRDDDFKLVATFLLFEMGGRDVTDKMTATEFLKAYSESKLTNFESIRRVRQKLQEENPDLRGSKWVSRKLKGKNFNQQEI